jgi:hypothetical protein
VASVPRRTPYPALRTVRWTGNKSVKRIQFGPKGPTTPIFTPEVPVVQGALRDAASLRVLA